MIKLQDFARQQGVTDRAIQKHLKKYATELEGHVERRGHNGTWLDDEGCSILQNKMKSKEIVIYDTEKLDKIKQLEAKIERLEDRLEKKEQYIQVMELASAKKQNQIEYLENEKKQIELKSVDLIKQAEDKLKNELQAEFNEQLQMLKEEYQRKLDAEKHRKLTLKERLFGSKE